MSDIILPTEEDVEKYAVPEETVSVRECEILSPPATPSLESINKWAAFYGVDPSKSKGKPGDLTVADVIAEAGRIKVLPFYEGSRDGPDYEEIHKELVKEVRFKTQAPESLANDAVTTAMPERLRSEADVEEGLQKAINLIEANREAMPKRNNPWKFLSKIHMGIAGFPTNQELRQNKVLFEMQEQVLRDRTLRQELDLPVSLEDETLGERNIETSMNAIRQELTQRLLMPTTFFTDPEPPKPIEDYEPEVRWQPRFELDWGMNVEPIRFNPIVGADFGTERDETLIVRDLSDNGQDGVVSVPKLALENDYKMPYNKQYYTIIETCMNNIDCNDLSIIRLFRSLQKGG